LVRLVNIPNLADDFIATALAGLISLIDTLLVLDSDVGTSWARESSGKRGRTGAPEAGGDGNRESLEANELLEGDLPTAGRVLDSGSSLSSALDTDFSRDSRRL
jgi:hypothetical protein